eukprot:6813130-Pyramimonas_sp.AAC.1
MPPSSSGSMVYQLCVIGPLTRLPPWLMHWGSWPTDSSALRSDKDYRLSRSGSSSARPRNPA